MSHPVVLPDSAQEGAPGLDSMAEHGEVVGPAPPRPRSWMIGPGKQVLSVEASTEMLLRVEQAVDSERQSELRFRELPQAD